jgi:hypothetical protein
MGQALSVAGGILIAVAALWALFNVRWDVMFGLAILAGMIVLLVHSFQVG